MMVTKADILGFAAGIIAALAAVLLTQTWTVDRLVFAVAGVDEKTERPAVEAAVNNFNSYYATFFNTGGNLAGLPKFQAENMVKRRILQELDSWTTENRVLTYDKSLVDILDVKFLSRDLAVVTTHEFWFLNIQKADTRAKESGVKTLDIKVRYYMGKGREWVVGEFEVYPGADEIPPLKPESLGL